MDSKTVDGKIFWWSLIDEYLNLNIKHVMPIVVGTVHEPGPADFKSDNEVFKLDFSSYMCP